MMTMKHGWTWPEALALASPPQVSLGLKVMLTRKRPV